MKAMMRTTTAINSRPHRHLITISLAILAIGCNAFAAPANHGGMLLGKIRLANNAVFVISPRRDGEAHFEAHSNPMVESRRSILSSILTSSTVTISTIIAGMGASFLFPNDAIADAETMERGGVPLTPFNSLAFNYRGACVGRFIGTYYYFVPTPLLSY